MAYRDDLEAMFQRASSLERELEAMREKLDDRDRRLAKLEGKPARREDTSPGIRALRSLPSASDLLARLLPATEAPPPVADRSEAPPWHATSRPISKTAE